MGSGKRYFGAIITVAQVLILALVLSLSHNSAHAKAQGFINITGTVTTSTGDGVEGASVYATDPGTGNVDFGPVNTDSNGNYDLQVEAGTYDFHYDPPSGVGLTSVVEGNVTVLNNQTINVQFAPVTYTFSGTLTDQNGNPLSGYDIGLNSSDGHSGGGQTDADGNFSITVPADVYNDVNLTYFDSSGDHYTVNEPGQSIDMTNGNVSQNLQIQLANLTVTVNDSNGNPVPNTQVYESTSEGVTPSPIPGSTGRGNISNLYFSGQTDAEGSYTVMVPAGTTFNGGTTPTNNIYTSVPPTNVYLNSYLDVSGDTTIILQAPSLNVAPTITSPSSYSTGMRQLITPANFTVTATGNPTPSLSESGTLPSGITFTDNGNGTANFTGMANPGTNSTYPITITASNGTSPNTVQNFTLTITMSTSAPTFTSSNTDTEAYGVPFSFTVTTTGYPVESTIHKVEGDGQLPPGVTLTYNGDGTATLSGTPKNTADGAYTFTLAATNSVGTTDQVFTMTITKIPVFKPVRAGQNQATAGTAYSLPITATGSATLSMTESGALPDGLSFHDNGSGNATISGTPSPNSGGAYPVTVTATNSYGTTTTSFTVTVNQPPAITSANNATTTIGSSFYSPVTSTGYPSPNYTLTGTLPDGLHFYPGPGTFGGTANSSDTPGTYNVTITATNSQGTATQDFSLTVL